MEENVNEQAEAREQIDKLFPFDTYAKLLERRHRQLKRTIREEQKKAWLTKRFLKEGEQRVEIKECKNREHEQKIFAREMERLSAGKCEEIVLKRLDKEEKEQVRLILKENLAEQARKIEEQKEVKNRQALLRQARWAWMRKKRMEAEEKIKEKNDKIMGKIADREMKAIQQLAAIAEAKDGTQSESKSDYADGYKEDEEKNDPDDVKKGHSGRGRSFSPAKSEKKVKVKSKALVQKKKPLSISVSRSPPTTPREKSPQAIRHFASVGKELEKRKEKILAKQSQLEGRLSESAAAQEAHRKERAAMREERFNQFREKRTQIQIEQEREILKILDKAPPPPAQNADEKHSKAARTYMITKAEMESRFASMRVRKDWKMKNLPITSTEEVWEESSNEDDSPGGSDGKKKKRSMDLGEQRLQKLCNDYVKMPMFPKSVNYENLHGSMKRKVFGIAEMRCGLCDRRFDADSLPGITTRATVWKLLDERRAQAGEDGEKSEKIKALAISTKRHKGLSGRYDKVALCGLCFQCIPCRQKQDKIEAEKSSAKERREKRKSPDFESRLDEKRKSLAPFDYVSKLNSALARKSFMPGGVSPIMPQVAEANTTK